MSFLALSAPPSISQVPTLAEAFFRTHWAALSARARAGDWYPADFFVSSGDSDDENRNNSNNPSLLLESKLPLLAAAIREVYYVYGPLCAWELQCHPYLDAQGRAFVAWSYAGDRRRVEEVFWKGIQKRAGEFEALFFECAIADRLYQRRSA